VKTRPVILLAEDSADDQFLFRRALNQMGIEIAIVTVSDGPAVIEYLKGESAYADRMAYPMPTMVILDLKLPKVSGLGVLRQMRSRPEWEAIPVVILSGSLEPNVEQEAKEMGAAIVMEKPLRGEQLRTLAAWLQE